MSHHVSVSMPHVSNSAPGILPRTKKEPDFIKMVDKYAGVIGRRPYNMVAAGRALRAWVNGEEPVEPLTDVSWSAIHHAHPRRLFPLPAPLVPLGLQAPEGAMGLEPEPSNLRLVSRGADGGKPASAQAHFVYDLAADLVGTGMDWRPAIEVARRSWHMLSQKQHHCVHAGWAAALADE